MRYCPKCGDSDYFVCRDCVQSMRIDEIEEKTKEIERECIRILEKIATDIETLLSQSEEEG